MLGEILGYNSNDLQGTLNELDSVTYVPDIDYSDEHPDDIKRPVRVIPEALKEFITDRNRSKEFYIDPQNAYAQLAQTFLLHLPSVFSDTKGSSASLFATFFECIYVTS